MCAVVPWLAISPLGGYYNPSSYIKRTVSPMNPRPSHSLRHDWAALGTRWLVLIAILFGTIISSIGSTSSHGLAALSTVLHVTPVSSEEPHEHAHVDEDNGVVNQDAASDHPHHGLDHSHDKAHALPAAWITAASQLPGWLGVVRPWIEMVHASRLERPPMG